jgi:predicted Zn-ribbon and HTH transcriptional regulator
MTEPIVCKKGKCGYKDRKLEEEWEDDCPKCELDEKIEHDILSESLGRQKRRNK